MMVAKNLYINGKVNKGKIDGWKCKYKKQKGNVKRIITP